MKPGDHPEFFRFPPPAGASRDSTILLDREGRFFHDGELVERPAMVEALHSWVRRHPDDGRPILSNGYDWCYLTVEDTLYFVRSVRCELPDRAVLVLRGGKEQELDPRTVSVDPQGVCYARVFEDDARFERAAQNELEPLLLAEEPPRLTIAGKIWPIERRA